MQGRRRKWPQPALSVTMSRAGPGWLSNTARMIARLSAGLETPSFYVATCYFELLRLNGEHARARLSAPPRASAHRWRFRPSRPRRAPRARARYRVFAIPRPAARPTVPRTRQSLGWARWRGLVSGPSRLKIVRTPISRRGPMACFMAAWNLGANRNPTPISFTHRATCSGVRSSDTPAASSTSALPDFATPSGCRAWQPCHRPRRPRMPLPSRY